MNIFLGRIPGCVAGFWGLAGLGFVLLSLSNCRSGQESEQPSPNDQEFETRQAFPLGTETAVDLAAPVATDAGLKPGTDGQGGAQATSAVVAPTGGAEVAHPRTLLDLQPFRTAEDHPLAPQTGYVRIEWINLNPQINRWFVLRLTQSNGESSAYHLQNVAPRRQQVHLSPGMNAEIQITSGEESVNCGLLDDQTQSSVAVAALSSEIYASLCGGRLYLRNPTVGNKTSVEWATDFLRNYVWGGEQITVLVRDAFYNDAYLSTSEVLPPGSALPGQAARPRPAGAPLRPHIIPTYEGRYIKAADLGIRLDNSDNEVLIGRWYQAEDLPGIFVSTIQPDLVADVAPELVGNTRVNRLDETEASALVYLVAFDLGQFALEYSLGTDHPALSWSTRIPENMIDPALPGPDGVESSAPLVRTGKISPVAARDVVASFVGGFKRYHGAFRYGEFSRRNHGTHYGFIESGTVFSQLQSGLATLAVMNDGSVEFKTWNDRDNADLAQIRHARQNGLPLIEADSRTGQPRPGAQVSEPTLGNWSGSVEGLYRTVRSGVCLQQDEDRRFLIYGFFSAATTSAVARVFQAYQCNYAMLLDINALEHTYLAVYRHGTSGLAVEQLHQGMSVLEKKNKGQIIPRFVGYADNRDFFYLVRRPSS